MKFGAVFGFDISTYQDSDQITGHVDFNKMRAFGASFVIIRVGQGNFLDADFTRNWQNARGNLPRGAYWFYDPLYDPAKQAAMCIEALQPDPPEGRVWLDLEYLWTGAYHFMSDWLMWLQRVEAAGFRVGIYTGNWWWKPNVTDKGLSALNFSRFVTWFAQYGPAFTEQPRGLKVPMIWQDGTPAIGLEAGVESKEIDHDLWNLDYDFATEWGTLPGPLPGENDDMTTILVNKTTTGINLRSAPDAGLVNVIGGLLANDVLVCDKRVTGKGSDGLPMDFTRVRVLIRSGSAVSLSSPTGEIWAAVGKTGGYQAALSSFEVAASGVDLSTLQVQVTAPLSLSLSDGVNSRTFSGTIQTNLT